VAFCSAKQIKPDAIPKYDLLLLSNYERVSCVSMETCLPKEATEDCRQQLLQQTNIVRCTCSMMLFSNESYGFVSAAPLV